ncbi:uncharacterized protein FOMMEDRAFT_109886 [Fomitiporia mediterranea MF3/22]|uniref:uncharacterized protein n=1 Tax=Fomitiporia mediterranea (strain MF3/22) TaxID=694068 RepID=UPI00044091E7|nr:uncharacterized protein FOMMEDRAFT_109886 [Fomitiporia mediterranea MF3/22]EJD02474.1 hypothetical protein FOMMEDRAFT_109886 [Fomitiporia mediterranea MF3/22]
MGQHVSHNQSPLPRLKINGSAEVGLPSANEDSVPRIWGVPLKYISLVTLAVQNASLTIIMHYSRITTTPSRTYSAASAVLLNELLKGFISLAIAFSRIDDNGPHHSPQRREPLHWMHPNVFVSRCRRLGKEIFSPDCWKLSIPAILYVIQNNLQFVAASNLEAATFQVSYQMKILTTAAFSVALLRKRLNPTKWTALTALALGVGIVQIQSGAGKAHADNALHVMHPMIGFAAVTAACFTSGLAGVYFEMVLKGSQADLWVRNVQLSLFSLLPALLPILATSSSQGGLSLSSIFANFGGWAWATVLTQVFGGLITALVIKYSDNILKAFATSISIVLSFVASVMLFNFQITPSFVVGASTVLAATWLYNQPEDKIGASGMVGAGMSQLPKLVMGVMTPRKSSYPGTPIEPVASDAPILGETDEKRRSSTPGLSTGGVSPHILSAALKLVTPRTSLENLAGHNETLDDVFTGGPGLGLGLGSRTGSAASLSEYQSRYVSRSLSHSPVPVSPNTTTGGGSRLQSTSSLSVPASRPLSSNGQLHPNGYKMEDSQFSLVNLDDSPGRLSR